jgi:hypothetical protein
VFLSHGVQKVAKELEVQHTLFVQMDKMLKSRDQNHLHNISKGYLNAKKGVIKR